jgi:hypothetical protein
MIADIFFCVDGYVAFRNIYRGMGTFLLMTSKNLTQSPRAMSSSYTKENVTD